MARPRSLWHSWIASSCLHDVPRQSGGVGDTGDMREATFAGDSFHATWRPPDRPAYCPQEQLHELSITVRGCLNDVDAPARATNRLPLPTSPVFR